MSQVHLHVVIGDDLLTVQVHLHLLVGLDVAEASELVEVPAEGVSRVVQRFVASADETAAFDDVVALVEGGGGEVLVDWVDLEAFERVDGRDGVLPDVADHIVEITSLEEVHRVRGHPELHVDVSHRLVLPIGLVLLEDTPDGVVLILGGQPQVGAQFSRLPVAESAGLEVADLSRPVPRHVYLVADCAQSELLALLAPEKRHGWSLGGDPALSLICPPLRRGIPSVLHKI